jgi:hypothetical protein
MGKIIPTDMIEAGMVLAESIINKYGQTLLSSGMRLESKHRKILKVWGVPSVMVQEDENTRPSLIYTTEKLEQAEKILRQRLFWDPQNEFEKEIYRIALERIVETDLI